MFTIMNPDLLHDKPFDNICDYKENLQTTVKICF